ncbi:MAG: V-type ATP synthase subunit A [Pirellulaceae bacterium]|nr:V-type ATP synthase subunit A [Pirellulaceae bacterium]
MAGNIVEIVVPGRVIMKNEVALIHVGDDQLKAEVLRVREDRAELQVFEATEGVRVGDPVELTGQMLSIRLGPGLLGTVYDGLQNPLYDMAEWFGYFLQRGHYLPPLDQTREWTFEPACEVGQRLRAGDVLGSVTERHVRHKIMVPFGQRGEVEVVRTRETRFTIDAPLVTIRDDRGHSRELALAQSWPVRRPLTAWMLGQRLIQRQYPSELLATTQRMIDTFLPVAKGGTACIPGPFGAGKTVLQGLIARYSAVDVVVLVLCGERAGEVLETILEFTHMDDPRTGGKLIDRTVVVCNTSSMPVAAREASIYTGVTIAEYYRQMGLDVLLIADSTSRWAQAMRETSARLEEIPGEEAYPAYLDSAIKGVYERAGVVTTRDGGQGSFTLIGTVSPAGGNFEEPVTQSTLGTVKCFLGLSYDRAYRRFYPAIDPLISWSRYLDQLRPFLDDYFGPEWVSQVKATQQLLLDGDGVHQMMQVTGEEGITLEDFIVWQKSLFVDMVYLQQDGFDAVDASVPLERQKEAFQLLQQVLARSYRFQDKDQARDHFTRLTGLFKNLNYAELGSDEYARRREEIAALERSVS